MNIEEEKDYVIKGMRSCGGEFAVALGNALYYATKNDAEKIKNTWPHYWSLYLDYGKKWEKILGEILQ